MVSLGAELVAQKKALLENKAVHHMLQSQSSKSKGNILIPAFKEFPIISVVHPAYQAFPNGGHGSFPASGSLRLS